MPKVSEMIVSKYLRKEDLEDDLILTIKDVSLETMPGDGDERRWVLVFRELPKGLVLNTTTIRVLEKSHGSDSDDWTGKKIVLYIDEGVTFKGQVVGGLRLRPHKSKATGKPVTAAPKAIVPEFDDIIP